MKKKKHKIKLVCFSDSHGKHWELKIPKCDIFIFAGDANLINEHLAIDFKNWIDTINAKHRILVMGNHDAICEGSGKESCKLFFDNAIYLENESVEIEGIKFWGSPYSVEYNNWHFMETEHDLKKRWAKIPEDTNIIITHCPCKNVLDLSTTSNENCGSYTLRDRIKEIKPKLHICGHLHSAHGKYTDYKTDYYNVSVLDDNYKLKYKPTEIIYKR